MGKGSCPARGGGSPEKEMQESSERFSDLPKPHSKTRGKPRAPLCECVAALLLREVTSSWFLP